MTAVCSAHQGLVDQTKHTDAKIDEILEVLKGKGKETGLAGDIIGLQDAGNKFTAANVEAALAEVKTLADAAMPTATLALLTTGNGASLVGESKLGEQPKIETKTLEEIFNETEKADIL